MRPADRNGAVAGRHRLDRGDRRRAVAPGARARAHRPDERPAHRQPDRHRRQRHSGRVPAGRARRGRARQGGAAGRSPRPARGAAGHHRRRGRARFRRRGVRRAGPGPSRRLAPAGRDRRRRLVRAPRQAARPRRLPPRQLGLFSRPRRADAARGAVQRLVLAGAARGSPGAGGRDVDRRRGSAQAPPLPPRHDALGGAAHLHTRAARHGRRARRRDRAADGDGDPPALRRLPRPAGGAREARRARPRPARAPGDARRATAASPRSACASGSTATG